MAKPILIKRQLNTLALQILMSDLRSFSRVSCYRVATVVLYRTDAFLQKAYSRKGGGRQLREEPVFATFRRANDRKIGLGKCGGKDEPVQQILYKRGVLKAMEMFTLVLQCIKPCLSIQKAIKL